MRYYLPVATLACLLISSSARAPATASAAQLDGQATVSLRVPSLRGSLQGQSGMSADLNGDGYDDLVIGAPFARGKNGAGALLVYPGSRRGFPSAPSTVLQADGNLGWSVAFLGDVPGTGNAVFAAGAYSGSHAAASLSGTVVLYAGGRAPQAVATLGGEYAMDKFGYCLAAGDFNGDGVPDLAVGAPFHSPGPALYQRGAVYVFLGPDYSAQRMIGLRATAAIGGLGFSLATGDLNGDDVDDLLLQASGKVLVYFGSPGSFAPETSSPNVTFSSADVRFGKSIAMLGDLDGDGFQDLAVGADQAVVDGVSDSGILFVLRGGPGNRSVNADAASADRLARITGPASGGRFGSALQTLAPADGTGIPDLAVGAPHADGDPWAESGGIYVFSGDSLAAVVDTSDPTVSRVLQKTARGGTHGGGTFWDQRDPDYQAIKTWIGEGALDN